MRKYGFVNPILIDKNNKIIAGHGRWEAAKAEGYGQVPTIRLEHLTEEQRRAYVIADNKLAEKAGWDREMLVAELGELIVLDYDLDSIGFEPAEIDALFSDLSEELGDREDQISPTPGPKVSLRATFGALANIEY